MKKNVGRKPHDFHGVFAVHDFRNEEARHKEWKIKSPRQLWRRFRKFWESPDCNISVSVSVDVFLTTNQDAHEV